MCLLVVIFVHPIFTNMTQIKCVKNQVIIQLKENGVLRESDTHKTLRQLIFASEDADSHSSSEPREDFGQEKLTVSQNNHFSLLL